MDTNVPKSIRLILAAALSALLLVPTAPAQARGCRGAHAIPGQASVSTLRHATLCLVNRRRAEHGLGRLRGDGDLREAAQRYAEQMVAGDFFSHVSPGGSDLVDRLKATGFISSADSWLVGENLAWGSGVNATPAGTVKMWMNSPGHRANILQPRFHHLGVGIAMGAPADVSGPAATYTADFGD